MLPDLLAIVKASAERAPWGWGLLATVLIALYKGWPALKKLANEREASLLAARAEDMDDMRHQMSELTLKVEAATATATRCQIQTATLNAAFQLVAGELARKDPNNPVLTQAREMIASASTGDFGMDAALHRLATFTGARE